MKVWQKILVAPAVAIAFLLALGAVSYLMLARQNDSLELLVNQRMARFEQISTAARDLGQAHSGVYRLITWIGNYDEAKVKAVLADRLKEVDGVAASLARIAASTELAPSERKLLEQVKPLLAAYRSGVDKAVDLSTVDVATGLMAMQAADARFLALTRDFDALVEAERVLANESYQAAATAFRQTLGVLLAILFAATAASVAIALAMSRVIVRPMQAAISAADRIAAGDLTGRVAVSTGRDETAQMLRALGKMADRLRELVGEVASGARTVAATSDQIAQGNIDLSQRTEEQAGTLEETASSMEELTSTVTQNADNAREATQLAIDASSVARRGGEVVGQVVSTMDGISQSSRRISEIIGVIDGIAFQTNILALNAAVEAARAGEQGRGFAVVASEVRSLAQRSASAAKEIKELIGDSVAKVEAGSRMVDNAGRTMQEIVAAVAKVSTLVAEIAAASQEQSSGIGQVNTAVTQMDQAVQQNASLVEEAAAATESMKQQAAALLELVSRFRLDDTAAARAAGEVPSPPASPRSVVAFPRMRTPPAIEVGAGATAAAGAWRSF